METIARFMIASTDLIEAEGRAFKHQVARAFVAAGLAVIALVMSIFGLVLLLLGLFWLLAQWIGTPWAAIVFGVVALGVAVGGLLAAKKAFATPMTPATPVKAH